MAKRLQIKEFAVDGITDNAKIFLPTDINGNVSNTYQLDCHFLNLQGKLRRLQKTTKLQDKKLALKEAKAIVEKEYKHRMSYGEASKNMSNEKLINAFVSDLNTKVKKKAKMIKGGTWNADNVKKNKGFVLNWIAPLLGNKPLGNLNELDLERLVDKMRLEGKSDKTIGNCRTALSYLWQFAQVRGIVGASQPKFPPLRPTVYRKSGVKKGNAFASPIEVREALGKIEKYLQKNDLTENQRHKLYMFFMWWKLLADTGMRPYIRDKNNVPLELKELTHSKNLMTFARYEKRIRYTANGTGASYKIVVELKAYYKENKIKNEQLCMVGLDGKVFSRKAYEIGLEMILEITGWNKKKDAHGNQFAQYSIRHMHITESLKRGERKIDIAKRCGTSVRQIEETYYEFIHEAREPII